MSDNYNNQADFDIQDEELNGMEALHDYVFQTDALMLSYDNAGVNGDDDDDGYGDDDEHYYDDITNSIILEDETYAFTSCASITTNGDASIYEDALPNLGADDATIDTVGSNFDYGIKHRSVMSSNKICNNNNNNNNNNSDIENHPPLFSGLYQNIKNCWGWSKQHIPLASPVLDVTEFVANVAVGTIAKTNLQSLDEDFLTPMVQSIDKQALIPNTVDALVRTVMNASQQVQEWFRPLLFNLLFNPNGTMLRHDEKPLFVVTSSNATIDTATSTFYDNNNDDWKDNGATNNDYENDYGNTTSQHASQSELNGSSSASAPPLSSIDF